MAAEEIKVGGRLGPYELIVPIAAGGMGEVWKARDTRLDRVVAIKFSHISERFEREARAIAALNHPNITQIYDVGENYIVMEYVDGQPVRTPDSTRKLLDVAVQIADGLAAAHAAGFVHRDLKPDNILITKSGRVKILDFGLAKHAATAAADATRTIAVTDPGTIVGTVAYMSPEQARGHEVDARSDQFSFGLILYELATGKRAFQRHSAAETLTAIIREDPEPLQSPVPAPLRWMVQRLLAKDPDDRYVSTKDLFAELRGMQIWLSDVSAVPNPASATPPRSRVTRPIVIAASGVLTAVLLLAVANPRTPNSSYRFTPFATTSASESAPAWSPDGRIIAYLERSEGAVRIMVKDVDNTTAPLALVRGASLSSLSWSADGQRVCYADYSNGSEVKCVARAGGQPATILSLRPSAETRRIYSAPVLSPDGNTLALLVTDYSQVQRRLAVSTPPGAPPKLVGDPLPCCVSTTLMAWSPDGARLLASIATGEGAGLWTITPDGRARQLIQLGSNATPTFSWLGGSRYFLLSGDSGYDQDRGLQIADAESGSKTQLLPSATRLVSPSASRDGRRIAYVTQTKVNELLEIPLSGAPPRTLTPSQLDQHSVSFSTKRNEFAFVRLDQIVVRDRVRNEERVLVSARDFKGAAPASFSWLEYSPDGDRIVFTCRGCERNLSLWTVPSAGGTPARVSDVGDGGYGASWSPDGERLVYNRTDQPSQSTRLAVLRIGGGEKPVQIGDACSGPSWSSSGEWILCSFSNDRFGSPKQDLKLVSPDGKQTRVLGETYGLATWSRDARLIYNTRKPGESVILERLDPSTGRPQMISEFARGFIPSSPIANTARLSLSADERSLAVSVRAGDSDIWILDGFEPPRSFWERLWLRRQ